MTKRWYLKYPIDSAGHDVDARSFTYGKKYEGGSALHIPVRQEGVKVDFNMADFDMPVVNGRARRVFAEYAGDDIQFVPVQIEGLEDPFWIMNVLRENGRVDAERSEFTKWKADDGRPDKVDQYRMITRLKITSLGVEDHIFRLRGWKVALVVSDMLVAALEKSGVTGISFEKIS